MDRSYSGALLAALTLFVGTGTAAVAATAPQYQLVDLGSTDYAGEGSQWGSITWGAVPTDWPTLSTKCSVGAFNLMIEPGFLFASVGTSCAPGGGEHAVKWSYPDNSSTVTLTDIGLLPGALANPNLDPQSQAVGYNQVGDVVGTSDSAYTSACCNAAANHAFLWNSGVMTDLGAIAGPHYNSAGVAVNDSHEVIGTTDTISSVTGGVLERAFVYTNGTMYNLTFYTIGGPTALLSHALWIDCQGNIAAVGQPASKPGANHSYLLIRQGAARTCSH